MVEASSFDAATLEMVERNVWMREFGCPS
jgi:hypothetical protein